MTIKISSRKAKGRDLQKFVRDLILSHFPLEPGDVWSTSMGASGIDLKLSPKARKHFNFDVECKNDNNRSVWACWKAATDNEKEGKALLVMKKNHHESLTVMRTVDLFNILEELDKLKNPREKIL